MTITADQTLDAKGLACPMPIVRTKKAMNDLEPGQVIEVEATDKGSKADIKAWADSTGHQYLGTVEENDVLIHYIRKATEEESKATTSHEAVVDLQTLKRKLDQSDDQIVLDVREPAEFAFGHIPGAINIPLGELDDKMDELQKDKEINIICRTGNRSDLAAQKLAKKGFDNVINVVPGMAEWEGETDKNN